MDGYWILDIGCGTNRGENEMRHFGGRLRRMVPDWHSVSIRDLGHSWYSRNIGIFARHC